MADVCLLCSTYFCAPRNSIFFSIMQLGTFDDLSSHRVRIMLVHTAGEIGTQNKKAR
jgi:hypothetical protein